MDKTIRRVTDLKQQQIETYRYWQAATFGTWLTLRRFVKPKPHYRRSSTDRKTGR